MSIIFYELMGCFLLLTGGAGILMLLCIFALTMLNDKKVYGTGLPEYLKDINSANTESELSDIITKHRQALYSLFSIDLAEGEGTTYDKLKKGDEEVLKKISDALKTKRNIYHNALGAPKGFDAESNAASRFDLRDDTAIFGLWNRFSGKIVHTKIYNKKNTETRKKILDTIREYNRLQWKINKNAKGVQDGEFSTSPKLLKGKESGDDAKDVLTYNTLEGVLKTTDETKWKESISKVIEKGGDGLHISSGIGGLHDKEHQHIARRTFVGLRLLYYAAQHSSEEFSPGQIDLIDQYIDQVQKKEMPCIRTIHSIDYQTHYMDELHDTLRDLNKYDPASVKHTVTKDDRKFETDLSDLFENGKAKNIENYALVGEKIKVLDKNGKAISGGTVLLRDGSGEDNGKAESGHGDKGDVTRKIVWKMGSEEVVIGEIFIDNQTVGEAKVSIIMTPNLDTFQDNIQTNGLKDKMPVSIQIPIKAIKQIRIAKHNAARTKYIQLEMQKWETTTPPNPLPPGPTPPPGPDPEPKSFEIQAHIMDKESLVKKSIEQDVIEEYQHKYAKRRRPKRFAMYTYGRFTQNRRIQRRLRNARGSSAIETDAHRQQRVSGSIGNFAEEYKLGLDEGKVHQTDMGENDEVNAIADKYIKGEVSRSETITQFNSFFENHSAYQTGMTGTDIMDQLDDTKFMVAVESYVKKSGERTDDDYGAIEEKIREFYTNHPTAKLHGIHFNNPHVPSKPEIDKLCDHILAYKSKSTVQSLQNITANVKLYKIEKDTVDLTQSKLREHNRTRVDTVLGVANAATFGMAGSTRGRVGLKMITGAGLAAGGVGSLGVVGGVAGMAAALQWMKTYRDYLTEAQKTHEDAMTMGTAELDKRIKELEGQIKKHTIFQKSLSIWGFGKHSIRKKQLNILKAVNDKMYKSGSIKPARELIQGLQHSNKDTQGTAIAETLARIKMGRELNTNFISGSNRGITEQERKELLVQLRNAAAQRAEKLGYKHIVPVNMDSETEWKNFRTKIVSIPGNAVTTLYQKRCEELEKSFVAMKKDIRKGRVKMAARDAATNAATSVTVAGIAAGVSALAQGSGRHSGTGGTTNGPHNEYALGKYDDVVSPGSVTDKAPGWESAFKNGDKVSFHGEASVDAIHATTGSFGSIPTEVASVNTLATGFDATTQHAVKEALSTELAKVQAEAIKAGADAGNVELVQQRWIDGVEEMLTKLSASGKTGVTIEEIKFDPSAFGPIDIQASGSGAQDIVDRAVAFNATVDGIPGSRSLGEPLWAVWPGFSNTYAKPGAVNDQKDSWSKNTANEHDDGRTRPWSEKGKQRREKNKKYKEHEKLMKKNREYREAYERYEQTRKHEEEMQELLVKKQEQLRQIEENMRNIGLEQDKIEELQREKQHLDAEAKEMQQNIDKGTKELYNRQLELEKIIKQKGGGGGSPP